MTPLNKNYVYSVKGLLIPKKGNADRINAAIDEYITLIPELTESLTENLNNGRGAHFIHNMETSCALLSGVYARWLVTDADAILSTAKRGHLDVCKKKLPSFISDLLSLSIEMQMAQARAAKDTEAKQSMIEVYTDITNNLNAISKLILRTEFDRALEMLSDMKELENGQLENSDIGIELINALLQRNGEKAGKTVDSLKEQYIKKIEKLGGAWNNIPSKILAVDDRPDVLSAVSRLLKDRYKVFCAPGGDAALKLLSMQKPDLFIFDIDMPVMDGFELARTVRAKEEHANTPILFLTSNASREYVIKAMEAGGNDFIVKPANHSTLLAKVSKFL